jgi:hypothetical protein
MPIKMVEGIRRDIVEMQPRAETAGRQPPQNAVEVILFVLAKSEIHVKLSVA